MGIRANRVEVGDIDAEGSPVPIPNTEVKLCRAYDTWLATARENRQTPTLRSEKSDLFFAVEPLDTWPTTADG